MIIKGYSDEPFNSTVEFKIHKFPDGQQLVEVTRCGCKHVLIKQSITSFKDLELISCAISAVKNWGVEVVYLYVPYFLGARSDRAFSNHGVNYLKQVICPIVNSLDYNTIFILDPHSDVLPSLLRNCVIDTNYGLMTHTLVNLGIYTKKLVVVSPDTGASKKIYELVKLVNERVSRVVQCDKHRNLATGAIESIRVYDVISDLDEVLVIDDICDGGRTFIEIAKAIKVKPKSLNLMVTHGIFSNGFDELLNYYDKIFTTNSYKEFDNKNPRISIMDVQNARL